MKRLRLRWLWITWFPGRPREPVAWVCVGGHKPLAHLPARRRRLLHLPVIRWRLM